jgi:hypothetical protein
MAIPSFPHPRASRRKACFSVALSCLLSLAACGGTTQDATPAPTTTITDPFSGAINKNGSVTFNFTVTAPGTITVTLTSLAPISTLAVGMILGTWDGSVCTAALSDDNSKVNDQLVGTTATGGAFCVRVYDVGNLTDTEQIAITVAHT